MALRDEIAGDWQFIDGIESVSITFKPANTTVANCKALLGPTDRKTVTTFGSLGIEVDDVVIHVWADTITGGYEIHAEDVIARSNGKSYRVLGARLETLETRWYVVARKLG